MKISLIKSLLLAWCLVIFSESSCGQIYEDIEEWANDVVSVYSGELETEDLTLIIEDLLSLVRNQININAAGREDMERIFFLSDIQVENILFKRYVNGPFFSIYELQAVEGLPVKTIKLLQPVLHFGESVKEKPPFRMWGDTFLRSEYQPEKKEGFIVNEEGLSGFAGNPSKIYSRTELLTNRGLSAGFIAEKDPGEPMFKKEIDGLDLMTGYLRYENATHWMREAVIGRYQASAGQGLALQSGMPLRKSSMTTSIRNRRSSFRPSLSASEASGLQGGYATFGYKTVTFTPFFSLVRKDGRLADDSTLTSIRKDGLHRTVSEIGQRKNTEELVMGVKLSYSGRWMTIEAGHFQYELDRPLRPTTQPYNRFYFSGRKVENSWISYMVSRNNLLVFGEMAIDNFSRPAFWNGMVWGAAPGFSLALGHRSFSVDYRAPLAGPMSESSSFSGEQGFYAGIVWELMDGISISSYFDRYRFKWLKFRVDAPSDGFDWMAQVEKQFGSESSLLFRYRHREKPVNKNTEELTEVIVDYDVYDQIKAQYRHKLSSGFQFTTLGQWHFVNTQGNRELGSMLAQDVKWTSNDKKLTLTGRYSVFNSSDHLARLYAYEPHVLYMFSVPVYSGEGTRYLLLVNYKIFRYLHLWLRAAKWHYSDREYSGTGYNRIEGNVKTTLTMQVRYKF